MPRRNENSYTGAEFTDYDDIYEADLDTTVRRALAEAMQYREKGGPAYSDEEMATADQLATICMNSDVEITKEMQSALDELELRSNALGCPDGKYDDFPKGGQVTQHYRELLKPALEFDDLTWDTRHELRQLVHGMSQQELAEFDNAHAKLYQAIENGECDRRARWEYEGPTTVILRMEEGLEPDRSNELNDAVRVMERFIREENAVAIPL